MIEGLLARWAQNTEALKELLVSTQSTTGDGPSFNLTVILVVGPPDPNALSYLVPRSVFERGHPVHVGALSEQQDLVEGLLDILEVMGSDDIVVFICENEATLGAAIEVLEPIDVDH